MCLYGILSAGRAEVSPEVGARAMFAAVEGAQLVARGRGDIAVYDEIVATYRTAGLLP